MDPEDKGMIIYTILMIVIIVAWFFFGP